MSVAPVEDVMAFIKSNPDVLLDFTIRLSQAIGGLLQKIEVSTFGDAYRRTVSMLIYLARRFGEKKGEERHITLPLSHYDLAALLGMPRETVSKRLAALQKNGTIRYEGPYIVITSMVKARRELER